jgi:hypothetical protein
MTITIKIKTDNAAFEDDKRGEILRILTDWIANGQRGILASKLYDSNGNQVGSVTLTGV